MPISHRLQSSLLNDAHMQTQTLVILGACASDSQIILVSERQVPWNQRTKMVDVESEVYIDVVRYKRA